jgi:acylglycerol lipase
VQLFTCGWLPAAASPKALVFLCHGKYAFFFN